jgi:hypothetical protein
MAYRQFRSGDHVLDKSALYVVVARAGRTIGVGGCLAYGIFSQSETPLPGLQPGGSSKEITGSLRGGR